MAADDTPDVTGLFADRDSAQRAHPQAVDRGDAKADVNLVMSDEMRKGRVSNDDGGVVGGRDTVLGTKAADGAGIGAGIGATVGAIAAAVAAVGTSIAVTGLGLVIAGPVAAALAGAGAGGAVGALLGALVGWHIRQERVKPYESGIRDGVIPMGVRPRCDDDAGHLEERWRRANGAHVSS